MDYLSGAASLYGIGFRSDDPERIMQELHVTEEQAEIICGLLEEIEENLEE